MRYTARDVHHDMAQRMAQSSWAWDDIPWDSRPTLSEERATLAMHLSAQSSYAEEAGMVIAAKLCRVMEDRDIRRLFAQQANEEARHSELFERYSRIRYGVVPPASPQVEALLAALEGTENIYQLFMMHTFFEGVALDQFSFLREAYSDDLLGEIYKVVRVDEANHVSMGIQFLKRELPNLHPDDVLALEHWCISTLPSLANVPGVATFVGKVVPQKSEDDIKSLLESRYSNRVQQIFSTSSRKESS